MYFLIRCHQLTKGNTLKRASPNFQLNDGSLITSDNIYFWGALGVGSRTPYGSQVAIFSSLADKSSCTKQAV